MRKIVTFIFLCIPMYAFCQIEKPISKGNSIISGGGTFRYSRYSQSITFNPGFGYFVIDNLAFGLNTSFNYSKISGKSYSYGFGPFAKYYFYNGIFLKAETFFSNTKYEGPFGLNKTRSVTIIPSVGYSYFLNSKISLEPSINYRYSSSHYNSVNFNSTKNNDVFFELKLNLFL